MFTKTFKLVEDLITARDASGAVALIGVNGHIYGPKSFGNLSFFPNPQPTTPESIFDLASLSKVVATTSVTLKLLEKGLFAVDTKLGDLADNVPKDKQNITIAELLAHTSGLPAIYPLYEDENFKNKATALETVFKVPLSNPIGQVVEYSCIGFITLSLMIEKLTGRTLDNLFSEMIANPLKLQDTSYNVSKSDLERTAYTEWDPEGKSFLRGIVHDENARALKGVSGNAGLFSTAKDLSVFCQMLLDGGEYQGQQIFKPETMLLLQKNHTPDPEQPRTLGWLLPSPQGCSGSDLISKHALGHTGFTGTSMWIDFSRNAYGILLTNRVHPTRANTALVRFRPKFYQAMFEAIDQT